MSANAAISSVPCRYFRTAACIAPPVNVLRLSLHPGGVAPRIRQPGGWRAHLLERLKHQNDATGDPVLIELSASSAPIRPV
ncbi:hypothetical protein ACVOMV_29760 [Mesorhizobium atlanticum]